MEAVDDIVSVRERSRRRQLPDEVASYVREQIMSGRMRPGDFLRVEPIAEAVGVSNTPVREGLLRLTGEGFVSLVPRRGFVVAPFTRQDVRDLFWAQGKLAGELAARAAKKMSPEQIARLKAILVRHEEAIETGNEDLIGTFGHAFHREINIAAESDRLALILRGVVKHLPTRYYATLEARVEASREQHPMLIEAFESRNARRARSIMESHIADSAEYVIGMLEEQGLWADEDSESPTEAE